MPTIRHATPKRNLPSIEALGLLTRKSKGKKPVVWLHASSKTAWAMLHTVKRHGGRIEDVVVLEASVPRKWLRKSKRGLWYSVRDVPPDRFKRTLRFADLSASPVEQVEVNG